MTPKLMPGWSRFIDDEGDIVDVAPGVSYHPGTDTPYRGGRHGQIVAVIHPHNSIREVDVSDE
jgi:hypothetical protein